MSRCTGCISAAFNLLACVTLLTLLGSRRTGRQAGCELFQLFKTSRSCFQRKMSLYLLEMLLIIQFLSDLIYFTNVFRSLQAIWSDWLRVCAHTDFDLADLVILYLIYPKTKESGIITLNLEQFLISSTPS